MLAEPLEAAIPMDYYSLLQLDFDASSKDVKRQYRQLQKWCHPDIAGDAGTDLSIILNEAYDTLMDEKTRRVYDRDLREMRKQMDLAWNSAPTSSRTPASLCPSLSGRIRRNGEVTLGVFSSTRRRASGAGSVTTRRRPRS
jgi:curved DNA-binding protein CbpA